MVTEAGKELLRNTINTAKFHNKILEENEMWKQWELERGLTMMVSDDLILRRVKKHHQCSKHRRKSKSRSRERTDRIPRNSNEAGPSNIAADRWDHSGYRQLYPDEADSESFSSSRDNGEKWDHSGFLELYPEEAHNERYKAARLKEHEKKEKRKRKKHHMKVSTSDTEIWEEFKSYKRQKAKKKSKERSESKTVSYDSHVKEWRKHL